MRTAAGDRPCRIWRRRKAGLIGDGTGKALTHCGDAGGRGALCVRAPARSKGCSSTSEPRRKPSAFCAALARARKPYRLVASEELERVAGSVMHGGIVALAQPVPLPVFDPAEA